MEEKHEWSGIVAYGAYVPRLRLNRQAVYDANKWFAAGLRGLAKGERSMANWDEDLDHHGGRGLARLPDQPQGRGRPQASTSPRRRIPSRIARMPASSARRSTIEQNLSASDVGGSLKAGTSALIAGLNASKNGGGRALVAAADKRLARVASSNELNYGDGAAALLCGTENVDRQAGRPSLGVDGLRRPLPRRRDRLRLRLGRALDPRRGLLEDRAAGRSRRRSPPASSRAATSPTSSCPA